MKRRTFIAALGGAAAWPAVARAQQPSMPVVGYLSSELREQDAIGVRAFRQGLSETGYLEGKNVAIEYRWAGGQYERLPELAADLLRRHVAVIATIGGSPVGFAAKSATATIPIIFGVGTDPVEAGLVGSLNRPEGNLTGVTILSAGLFEKRIELLRWCRMQRPSLCWPIQITKVHMRKRERRKAAPVLSDSNCVSNVTSCNDVEIAFTRLANSPANALIVDADAFIATRKPQIIAMVSKRRLPTIYPWREWTELGGLMSSGADVLDTYRLIGVYAGKILRGAKPADLPVEQSVKFQLALNLKTAKSLDLNVPPSLLARAEEVIE